MVRVHHLEVSGIAAGPTVPVSGTLASIGSGRHHSCGLRPDGSAVCWGSNRYGQSSPPENETYASISSGGYHTCALRLDGTPVAGDGMKTASPPRLKERCSALLVAVTGTPADSDLTAQPYAGATGNTDKLRSCKVKSLCQLAADNSIRARCVSRMADRFAGILTLKVTLLLQVATDSSPLAVGMSIPVLSPAMDLCGAGERDMKKAVSRWSAMRLQP